MYQYGSLSKRYIIQGIVKISTSEIDGNISAFELEYALNG